MLHAVCHGVFSDGERVGVGFAQAEVNTVFAIADIIQYVFQLFAVASADVLVGDQRVDDIDYELMDRGADKGGTRRDDQRNDVEHFGDIGFLHAVRVKGQHQHETHQTAYFRPGLVLDQGMSAVLGCAGHDTAHAMNQFTANGIAVHGDKCVGHGFGLEGANAVLHRVLDQAVNDDGVQLLNVLERLPNLFLYVLIDLVASA